MPTATAPLTLVGVGASTMQGVGDPQGGFMKRLAGLLPAATVVNLGVGGWCTADMLRRVPEVAARQPCATLVLLGCNDLPRRDDRAPEKRVTLEVYRANLDRLFAGVRGSPQAGGSLFVTSFAVDEARTGVSRAVFTQYMDAALAAARAAGGYAVWDLFRESLGWGDGCYAPDGLHYNGEGHALIAARVAKHFTPG